MPTVHNDSERVTLEIISGPEYVEDAEGWEHHAYTVRLSRGELGVNHRTIDVPWRQGLGITDDPTAAVVLEALLMDAAGIENARGFEDWATEYGYDPDSRKAEHIYNAATRQTEGLKRLLGDDFERAVFPLSDAERPWCDPERVAEELAGDAAA